MAVDANILLIAATGDARRPVAEAALRGWVAGGEPLHAPALLPYEVASGLTRAVAAAEYPVTLLT